MPDAGSLLNQLERSLPPPRLPQVGPPPAPPKVDLELPKGAVIRVKRFVFEGNRSVRSEDLERALAPFIGRDLTLADLRNAAAEVALLYRSRGLLAAASVPAQDATEGQVRIRVRESRFGGARVDPASRTRVSAAELIARVEAAMPRGEVTDLYRVDRGILIASDLSGGSVTGGLSAGDAEGETVAVLLAYEKPALTGTLSYDNSGARSTGASRGALSFEFASPRGVGDAFSVDALFSEGSEYRRGAYAFAVGDHGLRASLHASLLDFRLIDGDFAAAGIRGRSDSFGADLTCPLVRSRPLNVYLTAGADRRGFVNSASGVLTSDYAVSRLDLGLNANLYDGLGGGGVTSLSLGWVLGDLDLEGSPNRAAVASTTAAEGAFSKFRASLSRNQSLGESFTLLASVTGQAALDNLDSSEEFIVGGPSAVRAYPSGEGSGDSGLFGSLEFRWQAADRWQLAAFGDAGQVRLNANPGFAGAPADNRHGYAGYGATLTWQGPGSSVVRATWSRRADDNPNPSPTGADQDGSLRIDRWWLSAAFSF
ncbi:MAG: ShlB/FhaC/HecB family hemolysin secretion/activation protein [Verrucomicrobiota bacterium]